MKYVDFDRLFQPYALSGLGDGSRKSVVLGEPWCVSYERRMKMTGGYSLEEISLHDDGCEMMLTIRYMRISHS